MLTEPLALGIIVGLVAGKQIGLTLFSWLAVRAGWAALPQGVTWHHIYGAAWLAGIGFTMSIFIATLAFDGASLDEAKTAILAASLLAGVGGSLYLSRLKAQPG
jgi:NhaA family Na+:H+ antiporter